MQSLAYSQQKFWAVLLPFILLAIFQTACSRNEYNGSIGSFASLDPNISTFQHQNINNNCSYCHERNRKTADHNAGIDCSNCHRPGTTWTDLKAFNHLPTPTSCARCHEKDRPTALVGRFQHSLAGIGDCVSCHHNPGVSFSNATYNHSPLITNCITCHDQDRPTGIVPPIFAHRNAINDKISAGNCNPCHHKPGVTWKKLGSSANVSYNHANPPMASPEWIEWAQTQTPPPAEPCIRCHSF